LLSGDNGSSRSADNPASSAKNPVDSSQAVAPNRDSTLAASQQDAFMQEVSDEGSGISQQPVGSVLEIDPSNSNSGKPSLKLKSSLKSLVKMVHRTLDVKRKVQVVNLESVVAAHRNWRSNSEGYQNLFEFGAFHFRPATLSLFLEILV
jgi:hypothetical protein